MGCDNCMWRPLPKLADITLLFKMRIRCWELAESLSLAKMAVLRTFLFLLKK